MRAYVAVFALVLSLAAMPAAAAQDARFFLHAVGQCDGGEVDYFIDSKDSSGDEDGCGPVSPGGTVSGADVDYAGKAPLNVSIPPAHAATVKVYLVTLQPDTVRVDVAFSAGSATCEGSSEEKQVTNAVVVQDWTEFVVPCEFSGPAAPSTTPSFTLTIFSNVAAGVGYEEGHASRIELGALAAPPPTNATGNATQPAKSDTPGPMALATLAIVGLVTAVAHAGRRRA